MQFRPAVWGTANDHKRMRGILKLSRVQSVSAEEESAGNMELEGGETGV